MRQVTFFLRWLCVWLSLPGVAFADPEVSVSDQIIVYSRDILDGLNPTPGIGQNGTYTGEQSSASTTGGDQSSASSGKSQNNKGSGNVSRDMSTNSMLAMGVLAAGGIALAAAMGGGGGGSNGGGGPPPPPPPSDFIMLNNLNYLSQPDLQTFGIHPACLLTEQRFWPVGPRVGMPQMGNIIAAANECNGRTPVPEIVILDVEAITPLFSDGSLDPANLQIFNDLIDVMRANTTIPAALGYYAYLPRRDYHRAIGNFGANGYNNWVAETTRLTPMVAHMDIMLPSLYTFYEDRNGWVEYATQNLREARRMAGAKKVYAYVWPQYHNGGQYVDFRYIQTDYWRLQLDTIYNCRTLTNERCADGIVLWGGEVPVRTAWNPNAAWWVETLDFMDINNIN